MKGSKGSETKALIREAAFKQFLSKDYSMVPLKDIEKSLNLSRGCMSYHYPTKQELFMDVIDQYIIRKQDVENKMRMSTTLSLYEFIELYIDRVQYTMDYLSQFVLPDANTNGTRAYMNLILQAEKFYPNFTKETTIITQKELLLWETVLKHAQKNGEIGEQHDCRKLAKQFKYIFFGQSYNDALENGLNIPKLKEQFLFIYGLIKEGARAKEYELALSWLIDCGLVYKIDRVTKPNIPLIAYQDTSAFKLYILDVGILGAITRLDEKILLEGNEIFTEFKGSFTEQFVLTELKSNKDIPIFYWSAERATAEIDFLIQLGSDVIPIEVKASENLQAKSLKTFIEKYKTTKNVRTSMSNYREEEKLINIPLYTIGNIEKLI